MRIYLSLLLSFTLLGYACKKNSTELKENLVETADADSANYRKSVFNVAIIGSSTAYGGGASSYAKSWAGKMAANHAAYKFHNLSKPAYTTFHYLPDTFGVLFKNYPIHPDSSVSISRVIRLNPDVVIIAITTNDIAFGYTPDEYLRNLKIITDSLQVHKIRFLVTTPTLRMDIPESYRKKLLIITNNLIKRYSSRCIDIITLASDTTTLRIKPEYFVADQIHPNDRGHDTLFKRIDSVFIRNIVKRIN